MGGSAVWRAYGRGARRLTPSGEGSGDIPEALRGRPQTTHPGGLPDAPGRTLRPHGPSTCPMNARIWIPAALSAATVPLTLGALVWRGRVLRRRFRTADPFATRRPLHRADDPDR